MIERYLYQILDAGITAISEDPTLLDLVFEQYELSRTEMDQIQTLWTAKPPHVKHQFARTDDTFPLYAIVLQQENEADLYLDNYAGMVEDTEDEDFASDIKSSIWQHQFQILTYTQHPDHTLYLYEVAKSIFLAADLQSAGLFQFQFSGSDLSPAVAYLPDHLFARQFTIAARREFQRIDRASRLGKAFQIRGIHVDKSGSSSDVGGVPTLVTPFIAEDEE